LSYRPARLRSMAELLPWNRFLGSLKVLKFGLRNTGEEVSCEDKGNVVPAESGVEVRVEAGEVIEDV
jgi:hypothetical protein